MAQKVNIVLVDDLDGSEATESVSFGLDGTSYEIDLNDKNATALRDALSGYVGHARKVGSSTRRRKSAAASSGPSASTAFRSTRAAWAGSCSMTCSSMASRRAWGRSMAAIVGPWA